MTISLSIIRQSYPSVLLSMAFFASISSPTPTVPSHFSFHAAASTGAVFLSANWSGEKELSKGGASVSLPKWRMNVSIFTSLFTGKGKNNREEIKYELLEAIAPLDRGADASSEDRDRIEKVWLASTILLQNSVLSYINKYIYNYLSYLEIKSLARVIFVTP